LNPIPADRPAFSIVVVARNEARTLPHLLGSLWPFRERRGDLVLVDTGSQDETAGLARDFGCRVIAAGERFASRLTDGQAERIERRFAREGEGPLATAGQRLFHFARAREWAATRAKHDVIWHLDGSDLVEAFDLDFIDGSIRRGEAGNIGYEVRLDGLSFRTCRFYDRRFDRWEGRAHEGLYPRPEASATDVRAPQLECPAERLAVRHVRRGQKERNYLAGLALEALPRAARPRWLHYLGRELHYLGFHCSAVAALEEHASREDAWLPERSGSLCFAGQSRLALGEPDLAADLFQRAFTIDPSWREPLLRLAEICAARDDPAGAVAQATAALSIPRTTSRVEADENYTWAPHFLLYRSMLRLGRREEAREHWQACIRFAPNLPAFREDAPAFEP
jgi:tetratricopeptide (TPR) repeat protein